MFTEVGKLAGRKNRQSYPEKGSAGVKTKGWRAKAAVNETIWQVMSEKRPEHCRVDEGDVEQVSRWAGR